MVVYAFYETDTRVMQYANALAERGDTVDVLALQREGSPKHEVIHGINVDRIQPRKIDEKSQFDYLMRVLRFLIRAAVTVTRKHMQKPYQVIHIHSVPDFLVFAAVVPQLLGARVILDIHDILPEFYASKFGITADSRLFSLLVQLEKLCIAISDHVIIANHLWQKRLLSRSVRQEKCTAIINYPDSQIFRPRKGQSLGGKFIILYPGSLNKHQGLDVAIRAFARVATKMPGAEFQIYGEGPDKASLIRLVSELGLTDRVLFHDYLPTEKIADIMCDADLAVVPKRASSLFGNEAASTKIMEFMSLGVPVIASRTKIDSYYYDNSMVRFFESENEEDLANAIFLLWQSPELRAQLINGADCYVRRNRWDTKKQEYLSLLDHLSEPASASKVADQC